MNTISTSEGEEVVVGIKAGTLLLCHKSLITRGVNGLSRVSIILWRVSGASTVVSSSVQLLPILEPGFLYSKSPQRPLPAAEKKIGKTKLGLPGSGLGSVLENPEIKPEEK